MTVKDLEAQLRRLQETLATHGIQPPVEEGPRADHIEHGSGEHAIFLGLIEVEDQAEAEALGHYVYASPATKRLFRLEDQVTPYMHYPDPGQVARLVLQQKVSELEAGKPAVPATAPPMWRPVDL
jgi:hypothetical protein